MLKEAHSSQEQAIKNSQKSESNQVEAKNTLLDVVTAWSSKSAFDLEEKFRELKTHLPVKFTLCQREKSTLVQDLILLLRGEKQTMGKLFKPQSTCNDSYRQSSQTLTILKQIYSPQSVLRAVKCNPLLINKIKAIDYLTVANIIQKQLSELGFTA